MRLLHLAPLLILAFAAAGLRPAHALSCTANPTGVAFGNYDPSSATPLLSTGTITINCSAAVLASTPVNITLSAGASGSFAQRQMTSGGSSRLAYQLYSDVARSVVWGDGTGGSSAVSANVITLVNGVLGTGSLSATVYGQIPAGQLMSTPSSYSDNILVTVSF